jgi:NAD(P)-dependent dehydrogenase (short-subunit alcohol dehydrogenase family)
MGLAAERYGAAAQAFWRIWFDPACRRRRPWAAIAWPSRVAKVDDCARMVDALWRAGRLDLLINAAASGSDRPRRWQRRYGIAASISVKTFFAAAAIPPENRGSTLNIASDAGLMGSKGASIYCASKGGVFC